MTTSSGTASAVNSLDNSVVWQSSGAPSVGSPDIVTVDLTAVSSASRQSIVFNWISQKNYNWLVGGASPTYGLPGDFTIQTNTAAGGGAAPTSGWTTVSTVTSNRYISGQQTLNTAGINWVRMVITAVATPANGGTQLKLRIYTNNIDSSGLFDGIAMAGDSITANNCSLLSPGNLNTTVVAIGNMIKTGGALGYSEPATAVPFTINVNASGYYPLQENQGIAGTTNVDWVTTGGNGNNYLATLLATTRSKYITINLGTNDAIGGVSASTFTTALLNMAQQCWAANRVVIIPTIPWTSHAANSNVITLNAAIAALIAANPRILAGPDLYAFYSSTNWAGSGYNNQTMITTPDAGGIGGDGIHPNTLGLAYYRILFAQWFAANIYGNNTTGAVAAFQSSISVSGNKFVDGIGNTLFMRGANYSGYEYAYVQGLSTTDASGGTAGQANGPKLTAMNTNWNLGILRIPVNAASWFGWTVYDVNGRTLNSDPSHSTNSYKTQVIAQVNAATAAGFYVILDLHWISIGRTAPLGQMCFPDSVNGPAFWTDAANTFKNNHAVLFDLFNEPILYGWTTIQNGGTSVGNNGVPAYTGQSNGYGPIYLAAIYQYPCNVPTGTFTPGELFTSTSGVSGRIMYYDSTLGALFLCTTDTSVTVELAAISSGATITGSSSSAHTTTTSSAVCQLAGHQQMLNAVRAAGAPNVCLISGINYTSDLSSWLTYMPTDPAPAGFVGNWTPQIAASWHAYPKYGVPYTDPNYGLPNYGAAAYTTAQGIIAAGFPVMITETGGSTGTSNPPATANNEPFCSNLLAWATANKVTTVDWAWFIAGGDDVCITDVNGTPTVGQGQVQHNYATTNGFSRYGA